jgi:galactokinase
MPETLLPPGSAAFDERFGRRAEHAAAAPGRVNIIGEHTDYNDGLVLPLAIDRYALALAARNGRDRWRIVSLHHDELVEIDPAAASPAEARPAWSRYVIGTIRELETLGARTPPLDMLVTGTVPIGAGLSSSAALTMAVAALLESVSGTPLDPIAKARAGRRVEHEWAGTPCGIMDTLVACAGVPDHALLIDCRDEVFTAVPLPAPAEAALLVVDSGVRRALAEGGYADLRAACSEAARRLGVQALRDATGAMIDGADLPDLPRRCAEHVLTEQQRTREACEALRKGDLPALGAALAAGHASLRDGLRVSVPTIDAIVDAVSAVPGVFGARMTGGGFGGCVLAVCAAGAVAEASAAVPETARPMIVRATAPARSLPV